MSNKSNERSNVTGMFCERRPNVARRWMSCRGARPCLVPPKYLFIYLFYWRKETEALEQKVAAFQARQNPIDWLAGRLDWQLLAHTGTFGVIWGSLFLENCASLVWEYQDRSKLPGRETSLLNLTVETWETLRRRGTGPATEDWNTLIYEPDILELHDIPDTQAEEANVVHLDVDSQGQSLCKVVLWRRGLLEVSSTVASRCSA